VPYFLAITVIFLINLAIPLYPDAGLYAYLGNILLFKMFDESIINSFGGHFWFLSTIIQFYLAYPLLDRLLRHRHYSRFVGGGLLISMIYWFMLARMGVEGLRIWNSFFLQYLWEFCGGMVLARLYVEKNISFWKQRPSLLLLTGLGGMGLMGVMALKGGNMGRVFNDIPSAVGYTSLVAFCYALLVSLNRAGSGLRRAMTWTGSISYELYLLHMLVFSLFAWFLAGGEITSLSFTGRIAALPVALLTALLFSHLLKFLQRKK
jgi:peptidoglycan/LPS O-acetylase OafA/YrhL